MGAVFIDANIFICVLDRSRDHREVALTAMNILLQSRLPLYTSPSIFAICCYYSAKYYSDKRSLNTYIKQFFKPFRFTLEDASIMKKVMASGFIDLEDALQFYSALTAPASLLITFNTHNYPPQAGISIIDPFELLADPSILKPRIK